VGIIEQLLIVLLMSMIIVLIVAVFVTGFIFFFGIVKQIQEIKQNDKW
jgi:hypothetical protein